MVAVQGRQGQAGKPEGHQPPGHPLEFLGCLLFQRFWRKDNREENVKPWGAVVRNLRDVKTVRIYPGKEMALD